MYYILLKVWCGSGGCVPQEGRKEYLPKIIPVYCCVLRGAKSIYEGTLPLGHVCVILDDNLQTCRLRYVPAFKLRMVTRARTRWFFFR